MNRTRACLPIALAVLLPPGFAEAGTYVGTCICDQVTACHPAPTPSGLPGESVHEGAITYPFTFVPAGTTSPNLKICVEDAFGGKLAEAVTWAVETWNALTPRVHNCAGCVTQEVGTTGSVPTNLSSTILHELGHCGMAIDHTTLVIDTAADPDTCTNPPPPPQMCREFTSFTVSYGGTAAFGGLLDGPDLVRGSKDDTQLGLGGGLATLVHWFRRTDNDPIVVDVTPIDASTFTRSPFELPLDSNYSANSNVGVGKLLGQAATQSVMSRSRNPIAAYFGLSADDVNTVLMSRTGLNHVIGPAGPMNDDHNIQMEIVSCADAYDIKVKVGALAPGVSAFCDAQADYLFPAEPHSTQTDFILTGSGDITVNSAPTLGWNFGIPMFYGHFETGDFADWDGVEPPP